MPALVSLRNLVLFPVLLFALLGGLAFLGPAAEASAAVAQRQSHAATVALQQVGDPYRYGASGPSSFDCSGLMQYSFRKAGIRVPRTSSAQARHARRIPRSKLQRGDLMFFTGRGGVYHAAMFVRWSKRRALMVHSPGSGKRVRVDRTWTNSWFAASAR